MDKVVKKISERKKPSGFSWIRSILQVVAVLDNSGWIFSKHCQGFPMAPVGRCCSKGQCISMGGPGTWDLPVVETTLTLWDHCPYSPAGWMSTQERVAFRGNGVNKEIGTPAQVRAETPVLVPFWLLHSCAVE